MQPDDVQRDLAAYADSALRFIADPRKTVFLVRARFRPFEGEIAPYRHVRIGLNIGRTSRLYRRSPAALLDERWRRNGITVNMANDPAVGRSSAVTMIGLAVDPAAFPENDEDAGFSFDGLERLAGQTTMDAVAAQQIRALFHNADLHGCSTAYFSHALQALSRRLLTGRVNGDPRVAPLDERRLRTVLELIEESLGDDLSVPEMARAVQMDVSHFAKAFRGALGMTPFAYLTHSRMKNAQRMLRAGLSVTSVALAVNYLNPGKFSAAFRRYVGCSPTEWMARHR